MFVTPQCFKVNGVCVSWDFICLFCTVVLLAKLRRSWISECFLPTHFPFGDAFYLFFLRLTTLCLCKIWLASARCLILQLLRTWPGLKHRSHSTGQRYRSLFYQLVTDPNNSPRSKTAFWIVIRVRRHFWACLFNLSVAQRPVLVPVTCDLRFRPAVRTLNVLRL